MTALDASVLIAHINPVDAHHDQATRLLASAIAGSLLVHTITTAEILVGGVKVGRGAEMYADMLLAGIRIPAQDSQEPLRLAELRATSGLTLPDCCVLDVAIRNSASLGTFDHALAVAATHRGIPLEL